MSKKTNGVASKDAPRVSRRLKVITMLENILRKDSKNTKEGFVQLTLTDISRIGKELLALKLRI